MSVTTAERLENPAAIEAVPTRDEPLDPRPRATGESAWPAAFTIHCFHLGSVFVAVDESLWSRRRFFLDVARAWNGYTAAERQMVRFDWPQGGLDTGADRSFQAFFEHQASTADHRLVCGTLVTALLGERQPDDVAWVGGALYLDGQTTPAVKRRIWQHLTEASFTGRA